MKVVRAAIRRGIAITELQEHILAEVLEWEKAHIPPGTPIIYDGEKIIIVSIGKRDTRGPYSLSTLTNNGTDERTDIRVRLLELGDSIVS